MKKIIVAFVGAAMVLAANAASAGTLTNVSVSLSNNRVSQPTDVTIRYTTETILEGNSPAKNLLIAEFTGLDMTNGSCGSDVRFKVDGVLLPSNALNLCSIFSNRSMQIRLAPGQTILGSSTVEIVIDKARVTTKSAPGTYVANQFKTALDSAAALDTPASLPSITLVTPPPATIPTMTEWAMILLTVALGGFAALALQKRNRTV